MIPLTKQPVRRGPACTAPRASLVLLGLLGLALAAVLAAPAGAQENLELHTPGGKARSMGRAFTAVADDLTAIFWNPAGLADVENGAALVDTRLSAGSGNPVAITGFASPVGVTPVLDFTDQHDAKFTYSLLGAAAALPYAGLRDYGVVASLGFRRVVDLLFSRSQVISFDPGGDVVVPLEHINGTEGGIDALTLSFAGSPHQRFQLGVNINILSGTVESLLEDNVTFSGITVFEDRLRVRQTASGFSWEIGGRGQVHDKVSIGAVFRPRYEVDLKEGRAEQRFIVAPGAPGLEPGEFIEQSTIPDQLFKVPPMASVGLAIQPVSALTLAVDYHYRPWDEAEVFTNVGGRFEEEDQRTYATSTVSVGGEYHLQIGGVGVPLRGGFQPTPTTRSDADSLSAEVSADGFRTFRGGRVEGTTWSMGVGLEFETVAFDFAFERTTHTQTDFLIDDQPLPTQPILLVELDQTFTALFFSSTLRF